MRIGTLTGQIFTTWKIKTYDWPKSYWIGTKSAGNDWICCFLSMIEWDVIIWIMFTSFDINKVWLSKHESHGLIISRLTNFNVLSACMVDNKNSECVTGVLAALCHRTAFNNKQTTLEISNTGKGWQKITRTINGLIYTQNIKRKRFWLRKQLRTYAE